MLNERIVLGRSSPPKRPHRVKPTSKVLLLPSVKPAPTLNPRQCMPIHVVNFNLVVHVNICSIYSILAVSYSCSTDNRRIMKSSRRRVNDRARIHSLKAQPFSPTTTLPSEQRIRYSLCSKRCVHLMDSIGSADQKREACSSTHRYEDYHCVIYFVVDEYRDFEQRTNCSKR